MVPEWVITTRLDLIVLEEVAITSLQVQTAIRAICPRFYVSNFLEGPMTYIKKQKKGFTLIELLVVITIIGVLTSLFVLIGAKFIVSSIGNSKAYYSLVALVPALLFVPIMSAFRGFFQGRKTTAGI